MEKWFNKVMVSFTSAVFLMALTGWIQVNSRIAVLEVQVQNDKDLYQRNSEKADKQMNELMNKVNDIQVKVTELAVKVQEDKK
ncbi:hypothetical protein C7120_08800 [Prevotella sp. oral taxon 376]|uniref:hypothetical protein n=1 Tax=Prevotella sp. oral taxon 376 TaxID=712466 RepID=UPI000D1F912D|nr:hypothetical protein [Prevotella sp. oral taxon 376]PTL34589.1 hypothetical protein C7120_08800 [Prevotella sp. oral taxon 376]